MKIKLLFIILFTFNLCFSQSKNSTVALSALLPDLEKKYDVKFSFSDYDLANIFIERPAENLTFEEIIIYLNNRTFLQFTSLNNKYITVSFLDKKVTICGTINNATTLEPLPLSSIKILNSSDGNTADENGFFSLKEVPIQASLQISFLGFKQKTIDVKTLFLEKDCSKILLEEDSQELTEVIIANFLTTGLQKKTDGSIVLDTEKFGILPGLIEPDILKTIKILPGVESVNESISNINVRGGTNDQNLMIWDGIKMYHSGHFFGLISAYNPFLTKQISVTKNGTSSQFSDGVSSTINMKTNNNISNKFKGGAGFNLLNADVFVHIPIKKNMEIHVSGRRSFTDFLETKTYTNYLNRSLQDNSFSSDSEKDSNMNFYFFDYSFKFLYDINYNHTIRANYIHIKNSLNYRENFIDSNNNRISEDSNLEQENFGANVVWSSNWNAKFSSNISFFLSDYSINSSDFNKDTDQLQTQLNNVLETEFKVNTTYEFSNYFAFTNGFIFNEIGVKNTTTVNAPSFTTTLKEVLLKSAFYTELEYNKHNTYARFGMRANYFHKFNIFLLEPRVNIRQKLFNNVSLKLEGEFKNQTTTQKIDFQDNFLGIEKRRWILSNEENTPILQSKQASFGVEFSKDKLLIDITGFYKKVDGITADNQGFYNNVQTFNSIGNYKVTGVEFLVNKKTNLFSTWLSYTYAINDYNFSIFVPNSFPNNLDITHSLSAAFNYNFSKKLLFSIGSILRTGRPFTKPVEGNETLQNGNETIVNYDNPNTERLANFFRLDASLSYDFNFFKELDTSLRFGITNITNRKNKIDSFFVVDETSENNVRRIDNHSLPFTPNLSFRFWF